MTKLNKKVSSYRLIIDEEGYPVFNGLRVDDEALLKRYFSNIRRLIPGEPKSPLVIEDQEQLIPLEFFNAPLVAQMVENVDKIKSTWIFPGGYRLEVNHQDLRLDPWGRLNTYFGPEQIPLLMSTKAQQKLLLQIEFKEDTFPKFRTIQNNQVNDEAFWTECYETKTDGWELGMVSPTLQHYPLNFLSAGSSILVPGAGRGHEAHYFETKGYGSVALDLSPIAREEYFKLYPASKVEYLVDDLYKFLPDHVESYEAVFELNIFCAIDPEKRFKFIEQVHNSIKPGGFYFGIFLLRSSAGGPPFGLTQWELREYTKDKFDFIQWEISPASTKQRQHFELWAVLKKK